MRTSLLAVVVGIGCPACAHDPVTEICPPAGAGDLVVTELRPEQGGTWGQWVEVYNASGVSLDLLGTVVLVESIDGATQLRMLVRRELVVPDGGYVVLGDSSDDPAIRKDHVDYGFAADFEQDGSAKDIPVSGKVELSACGELIDRVLFTGLPDEGTYSLGADPPTADGNDVDGAWCNDTTPSTDTTEIGLPGTPGAVNIPCATP